jgi:hypothetical protein
MYKTDLRFRKLTLVTSALGIVSLIFLFQNCGKKSSSSDGSNQLASSYSQLTPLNANETLKLLSDGAQVILLIRQAAFNGTYPNQNPNFSPTTGIEKIAFESCVVATDAQGSTLQSRTGKNCPFALSFSTTPTGNSFQFSVSDVSLLSSIPLYQGGCSSSGTQTLIPLSRSASKVSMSCGFATSVGGLSLSSFMQSTWDLKGASRLEDLTNITVESANHKYSLLSDSLAVPSLPLVYTIDEVGPATIPDDTKYPTASLWPLFNF